MDIANVKLVTDKQTDKINLYRLTHIKNFIITQQTVLSFIEIRKTKY